jgi:hypothetical protein
MLRGLITTVIVIGMAFTFLNAQLEPSIQWKMFLNTNVVGKYVQQTSDKGYVITGKKKESGHHTYDVYLLKTDSLGNTQWERTFGYSQRSDVANSIQQTSDSGYILAGKGGDSSKTYLLKTDRTGLLQWEIRKFRNSVATTVQQTIDGGYVTAGLTMASEGDAFVMKIDSLGNFKWNKILPDSNLFNYDWVEVISVQQTNDKGYIISSEGLTKTDSLGNIQWRKIYSKVHIIFSVQPTLDGGYIATGIGQDETDPKQWHNVCLLKTNSLGNQIWKKTFGSSSSLDVGCFVRQTQDNGYLISGFLDDDGFVQKTDSLGNGQWKKSLGTALKWARCGQLTSDGGFIILSDKQLIKLAPLNQ